MFLPVAAQRPSWSLLSDNMQLSTNDGCRLKCLEHRHVVENACPAPGPSHLGPGRQGCGMTAPLNSRPSPVPHGCQAKAEVLDGVDCDPARQQYCTFL